MTLVQPKIHVCHSETDLYDVRAICDSLRFREQRHLNMFFYTNVLMFEIFRIIVPGAISSRYKRIVCSQSEEYQGCFEEDYFYILHPETTHVSGLIDERRKDAKPGIWFALVEANEREIIGTGSYIRLR